MTGSDLLRVELSGGRAIHRSPALSALRVPHAFTTRSSWDGGELGLDLSAELGFPGVERVASLTQVHGATVQQVRDPGERVAPAPAATTGDALVGSARGHVLLIRTADCVPVLLASSDGRHVAAVHAGWRGIVAGVLPAALAALGDGAAIAAIGPCLSAAHFEVGPEVAEQFAEVGLADAIVARPGARPHIDLRHAVCLQLERGGVLQVDVSQRCTWEDPELFSHRRDVTHGGRARTGRLGALIAPAR